MESQTLASIRSANEILAAKAPEETANYRQLVLAVAEAVAEAKSGVEPEETAALDKIKTALGG